jgi:hypothetical protein
MDDHLDTCTYCLSKCCKGDCAESTYDPEPPEVDGEVINDYIESGFDTEGSAF